MGLKPATKATDILPLSHGNQCVEDLEDVLAFRKIIHASPSSLGTGCGCTNVLPEGKYIPGVDERLVHDCDVGYL